MKPIIVANWKANTNFELYKDIPDNCKNIEICVAVPHVFIQKALEYKSNHISIAAQDCSMFGTGAYTGETPAEFLKELRCKYVIIGHPERRLHHKEDSHILSAKITQALSAGLKVIYCIGETASDRDDKTHINVLYNQFFSVVGQGISIDIAYVPLYTIGTGILPLNNDIQEVVDSIKKWSKGINVSGRVLYGGSLYVNNIEALATIKGLNGVISGEGSIKDTFIDMIKTFDDMNKC